MFYAVAAVVKIIALVDMETSYANRIDSAVARELTFSAAVREILRGRAIILIRGWLTRGG